jgi:HAE1 family hydrophobic/amphiphilic exporter-1
LIPLLAVPVSLVGTFMLFPILDFSINTLSLFGLVLAIGIVVDDAIVVVEAVENKIENGMAPKDAAVQAMREVTSPIIATTLILMAVFVPTAFIPGISGRLFQQFAVTIAVSVLFSSINALTLSPALAGLLLRPRTKSSGPLARFFAAFNRLFDRATQGYLKGCGYLIRKSGLSMLALVGVVFIVGFSGEKLPSGFLPQEDQGYLFLNLQLPSAASIQRTNAACEKIEKILSETPGIESYNTIVGFSLLSGVQTTYNGFFFVTLKPWGERDPLGLSAKVITHRLNLELSEFAEAEAFTFPPPAIPGVGSSGGITFMLEDRDARGVEFLSEQTRRFLKAARERPELARVSTTALFDVPQIYAEVNREMALKLNVPLAGVYQTMQAYMGGIFVNYFNRFGRVWQVYVQAEGSFRNDVDKLGRFYVKNADGGMVPLSGLTTNKRVHGPEFTMRFNQHETAQLMVIPAPGHSGAEAMEILEEIFDETMPEGMGYDYMGMAYQAKQAAAGVSPAVIFAFSLLMVFLILAAQYESWALPFSVLLTTPIAVMGAFLALMARSFASDVYTQIGLVMLIGLSAKNAILIVEFARARMAEGDGIEESALQAAGSRLRPILMTAFAFILGVMPLVTASGSGAVSRQVLGTVVLGGMLAATCISIFVVPSTFAVVEKLAHRFSSRKQEGTASGGSE